MAGEAAAGWGFAEPPASVAGTEGGALDGGFAGLGGAGPPDAVAPAAEVLDGSGGVYKRIR